MSNEQKLREALQAGLHYAQEALGSHDMANQRHPSTEPERNAILEDIRVITEALATTEQAAPAVPQGWKLVPVEPTPDMEGAGRVNMAYGSCTARQVWAAMLAATPATPSQPAVPQGFTLEQLADACAESGVSDSKFEAIVLSLKATPAAPSQPAVPQGEPDVWVREQRGTYEGIETLDPMFVFGSTNPGPGRHGATYSPRYPAAPSQERCCTCGYLTSEREHLGCLRKAVKDLDAATGGPYPSQPVTLTDEELEECFRRTHEQTNTAYVPIARFPVGWRLYGHQVIAALREKEQA